MYCLELLESQSDTIVSGKVIMNRFCSISSGSSPNLIALIAVVKKGNVKFPVGSEMGFLTWSQQCQLRRAWVGKLMEIQALLTIGRL